MQNYKKQMNKPNGKKKKKKDKENAKHVDIDTE